MAAGLGHLANPHFSDLAKQWEPFVELEDSDPSSMRSERSTKVMAANANAWIHCSIGQLPSPQLLEGRRNESKNATPLAVWLGKMKERERADFARSNYFPRDVDF